GDPYPVGPVGSLVQRYQRPRIGIHAGPEPVSPDGVTPPARIVEGSALRRVKGPALEVQAHRCPSGSETELHGQLAGLRPVLLALAGGERRDMGPLAADVAEQEVGDPMVLVLTEQAGGPPGAPGFGPPHVAVPPRPADVLEHFLGDARIG